MNIARSKTESRKKGVVVAKKIAFFVSITVRRRNNKSGREV